MTAPEYAERAEIMLTEADDLFRDCQHARECGCDRCEAIHAWRRRFDALPEARTVA